MLKNMIKQTRLYQPEKYKVFVGEGTGAALCTVWNNPEILHRQSAVVRKRCHLVGSLYSRFGVNVLLRNLALNPQIRKLYLWGHGPLSNTAYGRPGAEILRTLWQRGPRSDGGVEGLDWKMEKEMPADLVREIIRHVELQDISPEDFGVLERRIESEQTTGEAYMSPISLPEPKLEQGASFPSEEIGWLLRDRKTIQVWSRVVERVMRFGTVKGTQYGYQQKELLDVDWIVEDEDPLEPDLILAQDWPEGMKEITGARHESILEYQRAFLSPEALPQLSYTYGNRLQRYPNDTGGIDQIRESIIAQLKSSSDSRRAVAITLYPPQDAYSREPPCLILVQTLQSRKHLHLIATFRSHDVFKAAIPNAFALRLLQQNIADELEMELGRLAIHSQSAHIYEQDWAQANDLAACFFWQREAGATFCPEAEADPRGVVIISVEDGAINVRLRDTDGHDLVSLYDKTANKIARQISHLELLSKSSHQIYIGMELQKAELALINGWHYVQDKPLAIER